MTRATGALGGRRLPRRATWPPEVAVRHHLRGNVYARLTRFSGLSGHVELAIVTRRKDGTDRPTASHVLVQVGDLAGIRDAIDEMLELLHVDEAA